MRNKRKYILFAFIITQIVIFILSFVLQKKITLLSYINISFYFSFFFLLAALTIYIIQSGFFNSFFDSFRRLAKAKRKAVVEDEFSSTTPYSELISFSQFPILVLGLLNGAFCVISLILYYYL
ncbi:DUF3899 domain-containing protein [Cytobacillus sp. Hz8]|uniref:DUF3899 domain-containing protein n=1 Tax=Cytobacillus sp. Hz8 TaxID=3347168 RepID=UPI0035E21F88